MKKPRGVRHGLLVHVFVAGPEDCRREKAAIVEAILRLNHPRPVDVPIGRLPVIDHLHSRPQIGGRAQRLLDKQLLDHCDILVAVFRARMGTRTGRAESGTASEIRRLAREGKEVLVYFAEHPRVTDRRQFARLARFKEVMRARGLVKEYASVPDLVSQVLSHLPGAIESTVGPRAQLPRGQRGAVSRRVRGGRRGPDSQFLLKEDFRRGLSRWEGASGWSLRTEAGVRTLVVEESANGGIARAGRKWVDYTFEFETRIIRRCSAWIVRASDRDNYIMLQCGTDALRPHFRRGGVWYPFEPGVPIDPPLPSESWFRVRIVVRGAVISVTAIVDGRERTLLESFPTEGVFSIRQVSPDGEQRMLNERFSFPRGTVGFREWGDLERAEFRGPTVSRVQ